MRLLIKKI